MEYNATYYCNAGEYPASLSLLKEGLRINFRDGSEDLQVTWRYERMKEANNSATTFTYPGYPLQTLVVLQEGLAQSIRAYSAERVRSRARRRTTKLATIFAAFILAILLAYAVLLPWLAGLAADSFPASYEKSLGQQMFASMKQNFEVDARRTAYINTFFEELKIPTDYNIQVTVIKSKEANAFALPGGYIVVHDALLKGITTYEELAALLSHEFIHIQNRHSLRSLFTGLSNYVFLALVLGDLGSVTAILVSQTHHLKNLSYSRRLETEADNEGAALLASRGIDCNGFVRLFGVLQKEAGAEPSEWVSSHPNLSRRVKNIQKNKACRQQQTAKDSLLQQLFLQIKTAD